MASSIVRTREVRKRAGFATLLLVTTLGGCRAPNFEGPQLQEPPQGFVLRPESRAERGVLAHRRQVHHDAWVQPQPPYSTVYINGYEGDLTVEDALAAQDSVRAHTADPGVTFGGVEPLSIDGREAWGWQERLDTPAHTTPWVAYRAMIPYDTVTYTVEISTEDPALTAGAPESLKAIVSTFAVGRTAYNWPLIVLGAALVLLALYMLRERSRQKADRLKSIDLVRVATRDDDDALPTPLGGRGSGHPEES